RPTPAKAVSKNQLARPAHEHPLHDSLKLKPFRRLSPLVAAGKPEVAPDRVGTLLEIDGDTLEVSAAPERDRRTGQDDQDCAARHANVPLLRREAMDRWMDACCRLARHHGPGAGACADLHELGIAINQPGRWV